MKIYLSKVKGNKIVTYCKEVVQETEKQYKIEGKKINKSWIGNIVAGVSYALTEDESIYRLKKYISEEITEYEEKISKLKKQLESSRNLTN